MNWQHRSLFRITLILAALLFNFLGASQTDSLTAGGQDSLLQVQTDQTTLILQQADSARRVDSLEQEAILQQIADLRASDQREKDALRARLDSLQRAQQQKEERIRRQVDSVRQNTPGVPVIIFGDTVFYLYARIGPFTPSLRAANIADKVEGLVDDYEYDEELMQVVEVEEYHDLMHGNLIITSVSDRDAFWYETDRQTAASNFEVAIKESIVAYKKRTSLLYGLLRVGLLLLVIALFYFGIRYLNRGFTAVNKYVYKKVEPYMTGVRLKNYEFLSIEQEENLFKMTMKILKWLAIIVLVYLALPLIFSIFPATQPIATKLIGYVISPVKAIISTFIGYIPELFTIVVILLITRYFVRFIRFLSLEIERGKLQIPGFYPDWATPTFNILRIIIYAFAFVVIFPYLPGSDSPVFKGVSVFFGLLISLGSSSAIGNIIAGLVITYMRAFKVGDRVKIGDTTGDVISKTMLVTRLRTIKNEDVTIPNQAILNGSTVNYTNAGQEAAGLILHTTVTIGYDVEWRKVHELLISAATKTENIKDDPAPFVFQTSLDDFYVSYQLNAFTERPDISAKIYSELHSNIQDAFNEGGVEILSPHYRAARDGNMVTIPAIYLPKDYTAPSFTIKVENGKQAGSE